MRSLVSILTLTALLLHLLLGCEWLHAHAESHGIVANEAHDHHCDLPTNEQAPAEDEEDCLGCDCVFVVSNTTGDGLSANLAVGAFAKARPPRIVADLHTIRLDPSPPAPAAVRPHLFLQVILI